MLAIAAVGVPCAVCYVGACAYRYVIAHLGEVFTAITARFVKLTPFTIRMLIIHRYVFYATSYDVLPIRPYKWTQNRPKFPMKMDPFVRINGKRSVAS